jgi:hypothetical protein
MALGRTASDEDLLARMAEAARQPLSAQALRRQRASFVWGGLADDDPLSPEALAQVLADLDGTEG